MTLNLPVHNGRPSAYKSEEHCSIVIDTMKRGGSIAQVAANIGIGRSLLHEWRKKFPEFSQAFELGKELSQSYWESIAHMVALGQPLKGKDDKEPDRKPNVKVIQFLMARRFPDYYQKTRNFNDDVHSFKNTDELKLLTSEERITLIDRYKILIEQLEGMEDEDQTRSGD